jgi:hypothetical protein
MTTRVENKQIFNTQTSNLWGSGGFLRVKFCRINIFRLFAPSKPPRSSGAGCYGIAYAKDQPYRMDYDRDAGGSVAGFMGPL